MSAVPELLAAIRPSGQNFPLLLHIVGGDRRLRRAAGELGLILLRLSAQWIYTKEGWDDVPNQLQPAWLGIGFFVADFGTLLFLLALVLGGVGIVRLRKGRGAVLLNATLVIALVLALAYVVAVWAMAGKPA